MKTKKMCAILGNVSAFQGLLPLTEERPLDTLPFDCKYRLIDFPLSSIANANINSIFMIFNEGETRSVFDHIGGGKEWNLDSLQNSYFVYFYQDFLKQKAQGLPYYSAVIDYLEKSESEYTVFMGSNMLCAIDLRAVLKTHQKQNNKMTVVYKRIEPEKLSANNRIIQVDKTGNVASVQAFEQDLEKEKQVSLSMDIFIVQTKWLIEQLIVGQANNSSTNLIEFLGEKIADTQTTAYEYTGYLSNIDVVASYYQANMDMLNVKKFNALMYTKQKIYTKRKNEVPTYYSENSSVKNSQCATGCVIEGHLENSLISRRTMIKKGAKVNRTIVMSNAQIEEDAVIEYAILDKNVTVKAGVKISGTAQNPVVIHKNQVVEADVIGGHE
ncbi:glucose-1-phosphate adenylyltransferase, GlgD subunit [Enterococcus sp. DIV0840]|uniref:glucose-1-phosphate adenylyltransferase subunit GlgD n=1 Tax=Enterococcus TaxID=1350 RepID=UPI001A8EB219|nr:MULTISPECIES: glucose-1-phosphate adenylyltransferase subunit GlgD [Enterococcus]MBO0433349.1 glucose-1-phosphate adenylyltransferase subunit GlgD [Enterococcus sp. DIV0849a]MBO0473510.1 glucose-1-phosphate adenylyltransferase subunit GlgD [Enterococcus ureasiticus]